MIRKSSMAGDVKDNGLMEIGPKEFGSGRADWLVLV